MTLAAGSRLGPYEIVGQLGAGGMGEVYRARDSRLDRDVAVKVLAPLLAESPDALQRFEREAKAVAALSHTHIVALYDFGRDSSSGALYAVSELLEGETLRARLAEGPLPSRKAVEIAVQIAQGLAAAHEKGIVHRDLKPENVFLTTAGPAKILDFGLARQSPLASAADDTRSPTVARATDPGTVLGTVGYMSPEQVRGKPADHRSDIFSFGSLLYEMLSGKRAFQAESPAETMTAIAREDPPELSGLQTNLAPALDRIVRHCIEKDPADRFQSARDLAFDLLSLSSASSSQSARVISDAAPRRRWAAIGAALLLLALGIAAGFLWSASVRKPGVTSVVRYTQLTEAPGEERHPVLSPDGETLLYVSNAAGNDDIYSVRVGGRNTINLTADSKDDDWAPAFSPDGRQIAFRSERASGGIFLMGATGESVHRLTDFGYDPAWSPDGQFIAVATEGVRSSESRIDVSQLWVVSVADASKRLLSKGDAVRPTWSPDGSRIAFLRQAATAKGTPWLWTIPAAGPTDAGVVAVTKDDSFATYFPTWSGDGRWLYVSSPGSGPMNIWRVPVEQSSGRPRGQPEPVTVPALTAEDPSLSRDGKRLAYESKSGRSTLRRLGFDARSGSTSGPAEELWSSSRDFAAPRLSPDGKTLVLWGSSGNEQIMIVSLNGTGLRQLFESDHGARHPRFSPDGQRVAFFSGKSGNPQVWEIHADGSGLKQLTDFRDHDMYYPLYSPDGSRLEAMDEKGGTWVLDRTRPDAKWMPLHAPVAAELLPDGNFSWSRDGRFFAGDLIDQAYNQLGIYVESVETGKRRRLTEKGRRPAWLSDNRRILYQREGAIWILDSATGKTSEILPALKPPRALASFDLAPDESFLLLLERTAESDIWLRSQD